MLVSRWLLWTNLRISVNWIFYRNFYWNSNRKSYWNSYWNFIPIGILISKWNSNWIQLDFFVRVSKGFCVFFKFLLLPILGKKRNRMITSLWTEKHRTTVPYFYAIHNSNFQIYVKKTRLLANVNLHFENYVFVETRLSTIRITKFEIFHAEISINHCGRRPYSNLSIVAHSQETANWEKTTSLPK